MSIEVIDDGAPFRYLSVCSGIEAASVAWHGLGWEPVAFSEIEKFPSAVLKHHYPAVPNLGDMTKFHEWPNFSINALVGGTPCQAFSVAGLREGLADPRGNLTLTFLGVAAKYRPEWLVWENVPGVLSDRTNAFGQFLAGLAELGYGWAYRLLDAQYFGLAQRRKRVFVVACLGGWERAAAVFFEPESLRRNSAPGREEGEGVAGTITQRSRRCDGSGQEESVIPIQEIGKRQSGNPMNGVGHGKDGDLMHTLQSTAVHGVAHSLRATGFDASEDGTGRGTPLVPVVSPTITSNYGKQPDSSDTSNGPMLVPVLSPALKARDYKGPSSDGDGDGAPLIPVCFSSKDHGADAGVREYANSGTLRANGPGHDPVGTRIRHGMSVRRLTPTECERLQGFPDGYTNVPWRNKPYSPDGPRYKALGNSMAVPCMKWIGQRIRREMGFTE